MTPSFVELKDVSVRFRRYWGASGGIKEAAMRLIYPPRWYRDRKPTKEVSWGLQDINLQLKEGERLGIIGANGAGKSTLLKVISRVYRPKRGRLSVSGRVAPLIEIGAGFSPDLTGRENAFLNGAILGISRRQIQSRMDSIIEFSGLGKQFDTPVKYYSTGMNLRLAFTLATEFTPDILILDELYAGGDEAFIKKADQRLDSFIEQSKILIMVSHDTRYLTRYCTRAIWIDDGRIRMDASVPEVIAAYQGSNA